MNTSALTLVTPVYLDRLLWMDHYYLRLTEKPSNAQSAAAAIAPSLTLEVSHPSAAILLANVA